MRTAIRTSLTATFLILALDLSARPNTAKHNSISWTRALAIKGDSMYAALDLQQQGLSRKAFQYAWKGYCILKRTGRLENTSVLTICDFSQSSRKKRLYIIDLEQGQLLHRTFVAHGRNSGKEYATRFSNRPESHQSSLGFYVTRNTYMGEHGLSLRIAGMEKGFNDRALARNIVVHGANYAEADFMEANKVCGRSYGCPAVPELESAEVIETIKNGSCLFIYHPTRKYIQGSRILNTKGV